MSSVPRATFDDLRTELTARIDSAVHAFAHKRSLSYDRSRLRVQTSWAEDAARDVLWFGCDTYPSDGDDDDEGDGLPIVPARCSNRAPVLVAVTLLALTAGIWGATAMGEASAPPTRHLIHDATLPVTIQSPLLPDALG